MITPTALITYSWDDKEHKMIGAWPRGHGGNSLA